MPYVVLRDFCHIKGVYKTEKEAQQRAKDVALRSFKVSIWWVPKGGDHVLRRSTI